MEQDNLSRVETKDRKNFHEIIKEIERIVYYTDVLIDKTVNLYDKVTNTKRKLQLLISKVLNDFSKNLS